MDTDCGGKSMTARILNLFGMLKQLFSTLFISPDWRDWIDVALLSILIYHAMKLLKGIRGIAQVEFEATDVLRHPLVKDILNAYEKER